jgi:hypothetical protein
VNIAQLDIFGIVLFVVAIDMYKNGIWHSQSHTTEKGADRDQTSNVVIRLQTASAISVRDPPVGVLMDRIDNFS